PRSTSLSEAEAREIRAFVEQGGTLLTDQEPGTYDEHSRHLEKGRLADLFTGLSAGPLARKTVGQGQVVLISLDLLNYHQQRVLGKEQETQQAVGKLFDAAGARPEFAALDAAGRPVAGVEVHRFRNGGAEVVALLSNPQLRVNELGPPEFRSNERFEKPLKFTLSLPRAMYVTDVRGGKPLGQVKQVPVETNAYEPNVFLVADISSPRLLVAAPARAARGASAIIGLSFRGPSPLTRHVFRVEVADPSGKVLDYYSKNVLAPSGTAEFLLPLAVNDATGAWQIRVKDIATAQAATSTLEVF
ncbi:MAG: hypothetical protein NTY38_05870, partial [Acidobacteria bacterium]|nr:hypothetical protein [Acidobacteriota bacterium]